MYFEYYLYKYNYYYIKQPILNNVEKFEVLFLNLPSCTYMGAKNYMIC